MKRISNKVLEELSHFEMRILLAHKVELDPTAVMALTETKTLIAAIGEHQEKLLDGDYTTGKYWERLPEDLVPFLEMWERYANGEIKTVPPRGTLSEAEIVLTKKGEKLAAKSKEAEEPAPEEPVKEEPVKEEPVEEVAEEPAEEPVVEEPVAEKPAAEPPKTRRLRTKRLGKKKADAPAEAPAVGADTAAIIGVLKELAVDLGNTQKQVSSVQNDLVAMTGVMKNIELLPKLVQRIADMETVLLYICNESVIDYDEDEDPVANYAELVEIANTGTK